LRKFSAGDGRLVGIELESDQRMIGVQVGPSGLLIFPFGGWFRRLAGMPGNPR
jgi:hypothetical protein